MNELTDFIKKLIIYMLNQMNLKERKYIIEWLN